MGICFVVVFGGLSELHSTHNNIQTTPSREISICGKMDPTSSSQNYKATQSLVSLCWRFCLLALDGGITSPSIHTDIKGVSLRNIRPLSDKVTWFAHMFTHSCECNQRLKVFLVQSGSKHRQKSSLHHPSSD